MSNYRNRLNRLESRQADGVIILDLTIDGEHTQADLDRALASGQRVVVMIDDEDAT